MQSLPMSQVVSTAETAQILHCSIRTVHRQAALGQLPTVGKLPTARGAYLFDRDEIERLAAERVKA